MGTGRDRTPKHKTKLTQHNKASSVIQPHRNNSPTTTHTYVHHTTSTRRTDTQNIAAHLLRAGHRAVLLAESHRLGAHVTSHGRRHPVARLHEGRRGPYEPLGHLHLLHALLAQLLLEPLTEVCFPRTCNLRARYIFKGALGSG